MINEKIDSKCPNCGSRLSYDPKSKSLKCVSCSSAFAISSLGKGDLDEEEYDFKEMIEKLKDTKLTKEVVTSLNCENCGASLMYDSNTTSTICPFCASSHVIEKNQEEEVIPISGIIPFKLDKKECNIKFHKWIKGKFFAPNKFKQSKFTLDLYPIYLPFWTFDMECYTKYRAERGDYKNVSVTRVNSDGETVHETERELEWSFVWGKVENSFDDIVVLGSKNNKSTVSLERISKFDFKNMEKYNPMFLVGYQGEKISVPLEEGFEQAKKIASYTIEDTIEDDVGGDKVRILSYDTIYEDITFKQIMGPVYNGIYYYNGTKYSFVMNGQTGAFAGSYPMSGVKVFFFVLGIVAIVVLLVILFAM